MICNLVTLFAISTVILYTLQICYWSLNSIPVQEYFQPLLATTVSFFLHVEGEATIRSNISSFAAGGI